MKKIALFLSFLSIPALCAIELYKSPNLTVDLEGNLTMNFFVGNNKEKSTYIFKNGVSIASPLTCTSTGKKQDSHSGGSLLTEGGGGLKTNIWHIEGNTRAGFTLVIATSKSAENHVKELVLTLENKDVGGLMIGNTKGIENRFAVDPTRFAAGTGGVGGSGPAFANVTSGCDVAPSMEGDTKFATKVLFVTPSMGGFKLGFSYTPSTHHHGDMSMTRHLESKKADKAFARNTFTFGVNYEGGDAASKLQMAFILLHGKSHGEKPGVSTLDRFYNRSYNFSATLSLGNVKIGGGYIYNGRSSMLKNGISAITPTLGENPALETKSYDPSKAGKGRIFVLGLGYVDEKNFSLTFNWLRSRKNTGIVSADKSTSVARSQAFSLSFDKPIMPGLTWGLEGTVYRMKNPDWAYTGSAINALSEKEFVGAPSSNAFMVITSLKFKF